jgi:hypothetical protein
MAPKYWLMKAEPDSRVVKGKDVKVLSHLFSLALNYLILLNSSVLTTLSP